MSVANTPERWRADLAHLRTRAAGLGLLGLVATAIGTAVAPSTAAQAWLFAFHFWLGLPLGALGWLMVSHLTGGTWGLAIRRPLEAAARTAWLLGLAGVPLFFALPALFPWASPQAVAADPLLARETAYLNLPFLLVRTIVAFAVWMGLARGLSRASLAADADPALAGRSRSLSAPGLVAFGVTATLIRFDWALPLLPHWTSTIYGLVWIAGDLLAALALGVLALAWLGRRPPLEGRLAPRTFQDLGNLTLSMAMLWAYATYDQWIVIWSGDLHDDNRWYLHRLQGGWQWVAWAVIAGQFALPFAALLFKGVKRSTRALPWVAGLVLVARVVEVHWQLMPDLRPAASFTWLDVAAWSGLGGAWVAAWAHEIARAPVVPEGALARLAGHAEEAPHG